jgi:uncharacterized membrane protein
VPSFILQVISFKKIKNMENLHDYSNYVIACYTLSFVIGFGFLGSVIVKFFYLKKTLRKVK